MIKRVEVLMSFNEMKQKFPVGKKIKRDGEDYVVTDNYRDAVPSTAFISLPTYEIKKEENRG